MALSDGVIHVWHFNESSGNAADSVGSLTLTNNGSAAYASAKFGNGGVGAEGSGDWWDNESGVTINMSNSSDFSMACWASDTGIFGGPDICFWVGLSGGAQGFGLEFRDTCGSASITTSSSANALRASTPINDGQLHFLAVTVDRDGDATLYVDGASADSEACAAGTIQVTGQLLYAVARSAGGGNNSITGKLDEVVIWNRCLSGAEITSLYNSGTGLEYPFSGGGATGLPEGSLMLMGVGV